MQLPFLGVGGWRDCLHQYFQKRTLNQYRHGVEDLREDETQTQEAVALKGEHRLGKIDR